MKKTIKILIVTIVLGLLLFWRLYFFNSASEQQMSNEADSVDLAFYFPNINIY